MSYRESPGERLAEGIEAFTDVVGRTFAWITLALVALMAANVLLSYGFRISSVWAQELEWHLFVPICLIGMVYAARHGEHVRVDVLYGGFRPRTKALIDVFAGLVGLAVCVLMIRYALPYVAQSWRVGEGSANPGGIPYRYVLKAFIPLGFALLALQLVADTLRALGRVRRAP
jgi:TRAP-type mannitol/chloroaromatic compound transport system permease small subunit